jgi:hypothetical protein
MVFMSLVPLDRHATGNAAIERQIARQNTEMSPVGEVSSKIGANLLGNRATICGNGVTNSKWQRKVVVIRFF